MRDETIVAYIDKGKPTEQRFEGVFPYPEKFSDVEPVVKKSSIYDKSKDWSQQALKTFLHGYRVECQNSMKPSRSNNMSISKAQNAILATKIDDDIKLDLLKRIGTQEVEAKLIIKNYNKNA